MSRGEEWYAVTSCAVAEPARVGHSLFLLAGMIRSPSNRQGSIHELMDRLPERAPVRGMPRIMVSPPAERVEFNLLTSDGVAVSCPHLHARVGKRQVVVIVGCLRNERTVHDGALRDPLARHQLRVHLLRYAPTDLPIKDDGMAADANWRLDLRDHDAQVVR